MKNPLQGVYGWYRAALRNNKTRWFVILGTLAYLVSPLDISPDLIPIVGQLDDAVILTIFLTEISQILWELFQPNQDLEKESPNHNPNTKTVDVDSVKVD